MPNITNTPYLLAVSFKIDLFFLKGTPIKTGHYLKKNVFRQKANKFQLKLLKIKKKSSLNLNCF